MTLAIRSAALVLMISSGCFASRDRDNGAPEEVIETPDGFLCTVGTTGVVDGRSYLGDPWVYNGYVYFHRQTPELGQRVYRLDPRTGEETRLTAAEQATERMLAVGERGVLIEQGLPSHEYPILVVRDPSGERVIDDLFGTRCAVLGSRFAAWFSYEGAGTLRWLDFDSGETRDIDGPTITCPIMTDGTRVLWRSYIDGASVIEHTDGRSVSRITGRVGHSSQIWGRTVLSITEDGSVWAMELDSAGARQLHAGPCTATEWTPLSTGQTVRCGEDSDLVVFDGANLRAIPSTRPQVQAAAFADGLIVFSEFAGREPDDYGEGIHTGFVRASRGDGGPMMTLGRAAEMGWVGCGPPESERMVFDGRVAAWNYGLGPSEQPDPAERWSLSSQIGYAIVSCEEEEPWANPGS